MRVAVQVNSENSNATVKNFVKRVFPDSSQFQPVSPVGNGYIIGESGNKHFFYFKEMAFVGEQLNTETLLVLTKESNPMLGL